MSGYVLAPAAARDLERLLRFHAEHHGERRANRIRASIQDAFQLLGEQPYAGHLREDLTAKGVRFLAVKGRQTLAYRVEGTQVRIVRIFGPGQNIAARLR